MSPKSSKKGKKSVVNKDDLPFAVSDEVLACWQDGLYYLAIVKSIDEANSKCCVSFEDGSEYLVFFKNIRTSPTDGDISCITCGKKESNNGNQIFVCDQCNHGYHQACHQPTLDDEYINKDQPWFCRFCVFARAAQAGGAFKTGPEAEAMMSMKKVLPYDIHSLNWDGYHKTNTSGTYCYCGGPGLWYYKMIECYNCKQWFHEACLQCLDYPLLLGDRFFYFLCTLCNDGKEYLKRIPVRWSSIALLILYNLWLKHCKRWFDAREIKEFVKSNWDELRTGELSDTPLDERMENILQVLRKMKTKFGHQSTRGVSSWCLLLRSAPCPTKCRVIREHELKTRRDAGQTSFVDCNANYTHEIQSDSKTSPESCGMSNFTRVYPRTSTTSDVIEQPQFPTFPSPSMFKYFFPSASRQHLVDTEPSISGMHDEDRSGFGNKRVKTSKDNVISDEPIREKSHQLAYTQQLNNAVTSYDGCLGRLACGETCTIHGRRLTSDGRTEYLVEMSGTTPNG